jgi:chromate transporter
MAAVTVELGKDALTHPLPILMAVLSLIGLWRYKVNSVWLIAGGAIVGLLTVIFR